jgi:hypothetical protein
LFAKFRELGRRDREEWTEKIQREEAVARQEKAEAAYYSRLKRYPGTRGPGLIVLAVGALVWLMSFGQRRRAPTDTNGEGH